MVENPVGLGVSGKQAIPEVREWIGSAATRSASTRVAGATLAARLRTGGADSHL